MVVLAWSLIPRCAMKSCSKASGNGCNHDRIHLCPQRLPPAGQMALVHLFTHLHLAFHNITFFRDLGGLEFGTLVARSQIMVGGSHGRRGPSLVCSNIVSQWSLAVNISTPRKRYATHAAV